MKAIITKNVEDKIVGYECVPVIYGKIDLSNIPDNALEDIVAVDFLDYVDADKIDEFLSNICKKMRMNSTLTLRGHELGLVCRNTINNTISSQDFNKLITTKKSIHKLPDIINLLKSKNLLINNVTIKGIQYEISAIRQMQN